MPISNITKFAAIEAGKNDGSKVVPFYTCAGADPQVIELLKNQPEHTRDDALIEIVEAWDSGYNNERAKVLATAHQHS